MWNDLAIAIIEQAIDDYKEKKALHHPTNHIERFFKSEWCDYLLQNVTITGEDILNYLKTRD